MGFWQGIIIGIFVGANIGIVIAGLFAGCRRDACAADEPLGRLPMDEAVMNEAATPIARTPKPVKEVSPKPLEHS
jgi:hypothetical protein